METRASESVVDNERCGPQTIFQLDDRIDEAMRAFESAWRNVIVRAFVTLSQRGRNLIECPLFCELVR